MSATTVQTHETEASILARVLADERAELPPELARYILERDFSERDKARMHELAVRNQADSLPRSEKEELFAYARAGTVLSFLHAKARRALNLKPKKRTII
jgi:hypothetical protein